MYRVYSEQSTSLLDLYSRAIYMIYLYLLILYLVRSQGHRVWNDAYLFYYKTFVVFLKIYLHSRSGQDKTCPKRLFHTRLLWPSVFVPSSDLNVNFVFFVPQDFTRQMNSVLHSPRLFLVVVVKNCSIVTLL